MAIETKTEEVQPRTYFYYPAYTKKYARRVLAGIVSEGKIHVGEAICFTGTQDKEPDQFNKRRGRLIAENRALQGKTVMTIDIPNSTTAIGKLFVSEIEKVYPKHQGKPRNTETTAPVTAVTQEA